MYMIKSPTPLSPIKVSGSEPNAIPRRLISIILVINAALHCPHSLNHEVIPAQIMITFWAQPHIHSDSPYSYKHGRRNYAEDFCTNFADSKFSHAVVGCDVNDEPLSPGPDTNDIFVAVNGPTLLLNF